MTETCPNCLYSTSTRMGNFCPRCSYPTDPDKFGKRMFDIKQILRRYVIDDMVHEIIKFTGILLVLDDLVDVKDQSGCWHTSIVCNILNDKAEVRYLKYQRFICTYSVDMISDVKPFETHTLEN